MERGSQFANWPRAGEGTDRVAKSNVKGYVNNNQKCDSGKAGEGTYTVAKSYVKGYVNNNQNGDSGKGKKKGPTGSVNQSAFSLPAVTSLTLTLYASNRNHHTPVI
ncbi:hypothetical protein L6452_18539 [Arctium lappa]|uniref:Uncharacterized protein n=1 Tax=Arctium lappa TaxID=4217 RepID=A0ACB9C6L0_ARCLA|nr:hypothetical protein L6452_18539 [Arctium lappa]